MRVNVEANPAAVARASADWLRDEIEAAVAQRDRCLVAFSGGRTPWETINALAKEPLPWSRVEVFQVDERVVPDDDERRNARRLRDALLAPARLAPAAFHAMPVDARNLEHAAADYEAALERAAGLLPVLDVVQLGLGADGHTASLFAGDAVLDAQDRDVAMSGPYDGTRRMTFTYPLIDRARRVLWIVTGAEKADAVLQLVAGDRSIPGARVAQVRATLFVDAAAAARLPPESRGWRA